MDFMCFQIWFQSLWNLCLKGLIYGVFIIVVCAWAGWSSTICSMALWFMCSVDSWCRFSMRSRKLLPKLAWFFSRFVALQKPVNNFFAIFFSNSNSTAGWSAGWSGAGRYTFHQINSVRMGGECLNLATASRWRLHSARLVIVSSRYVSNANGTGVLSMSPGLGICFITKTNICWKKNIPTS